MNSMLRAGIIEGFYGHPYKEYTRLAMIRMASYLGFSFYVYAPKNDISLRKSWTYELSAQDEENLVHCSYMTKNAGLDFAFGISPLGLTANLNALLPVFKAKVQRLMSVTSADFACLLFDDVPNQFSDLGKRQNCVIKAMREAAGKDTEIWVCPTTYSDDPILTRLYGPTDPSYFSDLISGLDSRIKFFWTGPKVLSPGFSYEDIKRADSLFKGRTVIWHNYPVNDGKTRADRIYLGPYQRMRPCADNRITAVAVNPMTEGALSMIPLSTLIPALEGKPYDRLRAIRDNAAGELLGPHSEQILDIIRRIENLGLEGTARDALCALRALCKDQSGSLACDEIIDFLNGRYAFDPECLT